MGTVVNIEMFVFEGMESIIARCFTDSSIFVNFLELSMSFNLSFLQMKEGLKSGLGPLFRQGW